MTPQEIFDAAAIGVIKQGRASVSGPGGKCLYRGPDGTKCAAGHLIPDEVYDCRMDDGETSFTDVSMKFKNVLPSYMSTEHGRELILSLQCAHDDASALRYGPAFIEEFIRGLERVSLRYGLSMYNVLKVAKESGYNVLLTGRL